MHYIYNNHISKTKQCITAALRKQNKVVLCTYMLQLVLKGIYLYCE